MSSATDTLDGRLDALFASEPGAILDPYVLYGELREAGPVYEYGSLVLVTRYPEVKALYRDQERFSSTAYRTGSFAAENRARLSPEQQHAFDEMARYDSMRMSQTDGEVHDRLRLIAHRAFTPARIRELELGVHRYLDDLLEEQGGNDVVDLMEIAYQLPLMVIADLLGVPQSDREQIHSWSTVIGRNRGGSEPGPLLPAYEAVREFAAYVQEIVEHHRDASAPSHLVAALMDAEHADRMNLEELVVTYMMLLFAGHETTTNLIGTGMLELLRRPDQWRLLTGDATLAAGATEELLRIVTPVQWNTRVPLVDVEIAGLPVAAGRSVRMLTAGANRDPDVFAEPDDVDITRANARDHLALGFGPHFCLGASLARLEGAVSFATLAERYPRMELAADEFEWTGSATLRRLARLPVTLG